MALLDELKNAQKDAMRAKDKLRLGTIRMALAAVKQRFGDTWQQSFLPEGYEDLIERCFVRHFDMNGGWQV